MYQGFISTIASSLYGKGIPYMVIRGQAVLVHGEPHLTRDIDVTLGVGPEGLDRDYIRGWLKEFDVSIPGSGLVSLFESL